MATFQPPINIDPTQDASIQASFINQNFQSIASALETSSFRIVQTGVVKGPTISPGASPTTTQVAHNLGVVPAALVYLGSPGEENQALPVVQLLSGNVTNISINYYITYAVDASNLYIFQYTSNSAGTLGPFPYTYFLLQQTIG